MKKYIWIALTLITAACAVPPAPVHPPQPGPPPANATWLVDAVACSDAGAAPFACQTPIAGATIQMHGPSGYITKTADGAGYAVFELPAPFPDSDVNISADGYVPIVGQHIDVAGTHDSSRHNIVVLAPAHVDPSGIPLEQLAAIRGAMWPARMSIGYGPRPGSPDNILAMDFYQLYDAPTRAAMLVQYHDVDGFTHAVTGPLSGTDCYHGQYPCHDPSNPGSFPQDGAPSQAQWDRYLDGLQEWWDKGVAPIFFIKPDGWTFAQTRDAFTPLLQQPRAQKLIRIAVGPGWEPWKYEASSCTWALFAQWVRTTLPNALSLIHTVSDVDAPAGTDALCNDDDHAWNPDGNAGAWRRVAPYVHGWLIQNGPYYTSPTDDPKTAYNFGAQFLASGDGAAVHSVAWHFAGNAGWPTTSAWGNQPVCLYNAENTSYAAYWNNLPMADSIAWGNLAMSGASVACGYLDGGSVRVPVRR